MTIPTDPLQPTDGWLQADPPRILPPPPAERGVAFRTVSRASRWFGRKQLPNVFPVFHVNPRLFWPWLWFASRLMPFGRLDAPTREKLILRTAWNCRSHYEWMQHVEIGLRTGLTDADILYVAGRQAPPPDPRDASLRDACDDICRHHPVADATWAALAAHYDAAALIEITVLVGHYLMVAALLVNAGVQVETDAEAVLAAFHARVAPALARH
ncbi:MAG: carboxymuconolactone decarboxylase family protein [Nevskiaceae bacterium]|nr:MAG: carboxymuconolactone decarboxylase family protein [Nevskiaceae bacterium]TBR74624.1 MAG: carboxymuconolactone decarboxylase family protein [Nevskiaceae bacterium]